MATPSGQISFNDLEYEIFVLTGYQLSLDQNEVRNLTGQMVGAVDMNTAKNKSYTIPGNSGVITSGSSYTLPRTSGTTIGIIAVGAGGGGGGGSGRTSFYGYFTGGGGGGAGGCMYRYVTGVTPGSTVNFYIGSGGAGGSPRDGGFGPAYNGTIGQASYASIGGTTYVYAFAGAGGATSPGGTGGGGSSGLVGNTLFTGADGAAAPGGATSGGGGAPGYNFNTSTGLSVGSIVSQGSYGTGYGQGSGGYSSPGTGYGAGGTGGGCSQSDVYNYNNIYSNSGTQGCIFIWWGY